MAGSAFPVTIDVRESVGVLKKVDKKEKAKYITCEARELQPFFARPCDNTWLESSSGDVEKLEKGERLLLS